MLKTKVPLRILGGFLNLRGFDNREGFLPPQKQVVPFGGVGFGGPPQVWSEYIWAQFLTRAQVQNSGSADVDLTPMGTWRLATPTCLLRQRTKQEAL